MFTLRFDMRSPASAAPATELYRAALDICAWAEDQGGLTVVLSEHHMSEDGYLPAPLILASAIAARTSRIPIRIAVLQLPLYDPIRLAEHMCVLDHLSEGRVSYVGGVGYRREEYEMMGVEFARRGALADAHLALLLEALKGQPFTHQGRRIHVTPEPYTDGGPSIAWGGGSLAAVRRAGRFGLDFLGEKADLTLANAYADACKAHGHAPGMCLLPPRDLATTVFVSDDLDAAWAELGPYLMNDVLGYARWNEGREDVTSLSFARSAQALRVENRATRIMTVSEAAATMRSGLPLGLHPLVGGLPPKIAWRYLRKAAEAINALARESADGSAAVS